LFPGTSLFLSQSHPKRALIVCRTSYRWSKELFSISCKKPNSRRYFHVRTLLSLSLTHISPDLLTRLSRYNSVVNPVSSLTLPKLNEASAACRKLFFNTRLGTLCRPEFMLKGDGLASTYAQAERLSIDYWGRLNEVLTGVSLSRVYLRGKSLIGRQEVHRTYRKVRQWFDT